MKKFIAQIVVQLKPTIKDIKGLTLKQATENILPVNNLSCRVGNFYTLEFEADNLIQANGYVDKLSSEILSNSIIETYELVKLEEINE